MVAGPPREALAPWLRRAAAQLIDLAIPVVPTLGVAVAVGGPAGVVIAGLWPFLYAFYAAAAMARLEERNGQTLGKQLLGIRVVWDDRPAITFLHSLYREGCAKMFWWVLTAWVWAIIDCAFPLWDAENEAWHDGVADTHVLRANPAAVPVLAPLPEAPGGAFSAPAR
jgi:uncharacterized RDD family membrane protein YckC